jgi:hypothetical protein
MTPQIGVPGTMALRVPTIRGRILQKLLLPNF